MIMSRISRVLSLLGFACECRLHAAVCTLLPDNLNYKIIVMVKRNHSLHRKVVTLRSEQGSMRVMAFHLTNSICIKKILFLRPWVGLNHQPFG